MRMYRLGISFLFLSFVLICTYPTLAEDTKYEIVSADNEKDVYYLEDVSRFRTDGPKVALALGGGGARALVNVGVLKALEEENIPIDMVIGTSMGAIVAVLYGSGMSVQQIEQLVTEVNLPQMFNLNFPFVRSLLNTSEMNYFLEDTFPVKRMEDFPIPTALLSYDLNRGVKYIATSGRVGEVIQGPYAIPLCFAGQPLDDFFLIDAGVWELVPAKAARILGAEVVISTTAYDKLPYTDYNSSLRSWSRVINIVKENNSVEIVKEYSDAVIAHDVGNYSFMDFHLAKEFIALGYNETKKQIPAIKALLAEKNIPVRTPQAKQELNMQNVLNDVKYKRTELDTLVFKTVFYFGKEHGVMQQNLFKSPLFTPQYGVELNSKKFNVGLVTCGTKLDNLGVELKLKKVTPNNDLIGLVNLNPERKDWEVGVTHYANNYTVKAGLASLAEKEFIHVKNTYDFTGKYLSLKGESDLLLNLQSLGDVQSYEGITSQELDLPLIGGIRLVPKVVFSNAKVMAPPQIYRGASITEFPSTQASLELVYTQHFKYSLELIQVIQAADVEYRQFIDYQNSGAYAIGSGVNFHANILGVKPAELGGFISYEPQGKFKAALDIDFTF